MSSRPIYSGYLPNGHCHHHSYNHRAPNNDCTKWTSRFSCIIAVIPTIIIRGSTHKISICILLVRIMSLRNYDWPSFSQVMKFWSQSRTKHLWLQVPSNLLSNRVFQSQRSWHLGLKHCVFIGLGDCCLHYSVFTVFPTFLWQPEYLLGVKMSSNGRAMI